MALRWMEGFDVSVDDVALARIYTGANTFLPVNMTQDNPADLRVGDIYGRSGSDDEAILHTPDLVGSPENSWIIGFAFRSDDNTNIETAGVSPHVALHNTDGEQIRIEAYEAFPASAKPLGLYFGWRIMRGAVEIARTDQVFEMSFLDDQMWVYFEFKVTIDDAAGVVEGRFRYIRQTTKNSGSGFETFTWDNAVSSIDTQNQVSTGADSFVLSFDTGTTNDRVSFDDLYVCDSTGAKNNDFLGKCFVTPQRITTSGGGDGDTVDWALVTATSTEDAWQEPATSVEDDDRLTSDTTSQIHLADMDALVAMADATIIGVQLALHGKMETTGSLDIGFMWRKTTATAAQIEFGTQMNVSSTTVVAQTVIAEDDPNTLTDWVFADLDTTQYGCINNG